MVADPARDAAAFARPLSPRNPTSPIATTDAFSIGAAAGLAALRRRSWLLAGARLADGSIADVLIAGGVVAHVGSLAAVLPEDGALSVPVVDLSGFVLLPSFIEPHAHLDKAYTADTVPNGAGNLAGAIDAWIGVRAGFTTANIRERAERTAQSLVAGGATAIRSHADTGPDIGLRAVDALLATRAALADVVDIQVVACGALPLSGADGAANRATLETALDAGADGIGGAPWLDPDPGGALDFLVGLGRERDLPLDLHLDETLDEASLSLELLLSRLEGLGHIEPGRVTASHAVSLAMQSPAAQQRIAAAVAAAGVGVIALPRSNLYLQGRGLSTAIPRGLTAVRALLDAGAVIAGGGDNLRDPFTPIGRPDPLETASLLVSAGHLSPSEAIAAVTAGARSVMGLPPVAVEVGSQADLVAIRASSLVDAIGGASSERLVFKSGRLVARTRVLSEVAL